jgi:hypothetical protein
MQPSQRPPKRPPKRPPPFPAELPSFASTEWVSITSDGGKYTKKRRIAHTKFDATPLPPPKLKRAKPPPPDIPQEDQDQEDQDHEPSAFKGTSRAASVMAQHFQMLNLRTDPLAGHASGLDAVLSAIP